MQSQIPNRVKNILLVHAQETACQVQELGSTQPILMKGEIKYDRVQSKLMKEGEKINRRQLRSQVKQEGDTPDSQRKGSITYRSYSLEFKKKLISSIKVQADREELPLSKIIRSKAKQYGIHPKNITRWYHTKELKKKQGGRKALYPQMEQKLANFILNNPKMRRKHILRQAKQIMEDLHIPGREHFNFSKGWYERFRERLAKQKILPPIKREEKQYYLKKEEENQSNNSKDSVKMQDFSYGSQKQFNSASFSSNQVKIEQQQEQMPFLQSDSSSKSAKSKTVKSRISMRMKLRSHPKSDDEIFYESSKSKLNLSIGTIREEEASNISIKHDH